MKKGFLPKSLPLRLVAFAGTHPKTVIGAYFCILLLAVFSLGRIQIDSDFLALVPEDNKVVQDFRSTIDRFGAIDNLFVVIDLPESGLDEAYLEYADILAEHLRESENIVWVEYRLQDFSEAAETLLDRVTLFLGDEELEKFKQRFTEDHAAESAERVAEKLKSPMDAAYKQLVLKDPLDMMSIFSDRLIDQELTDRFDKQGYLVDEKETLILMMAKPTGVAADLPFSRRLMQELEDIKTNVNQEWLEEYPEYEAPNVGFGGGSPIAAAEGALITRDMIGGMAFSMVAVVVLFSLAFGRPTAIIISAVPLIAGLAITFAFLAIVVGKLNSATSAFAALLIGLGVDFIIVLYSRYLEERGRGATHMEALTVFGRHTATGVLLGAVTTAATFYAFLISSFKGLSELGLLTGTGILLLVITVFLLLPALLTMLEKNKPGAEHLPRAFGMEKLGKLSHTSPRLIVGVAIVITLFLGIKLPNVYYDNDVRNMRSPENPGLMVQDRVMNAFGIRFTPQMVRVDGKTEEDVIQRSREILTELNKLIDGENLARVDSPFTYYPERSRQENVIENLKAANIDTQAFREAFKKELDKRELRADPFLEAIDPLLDSLSVQKPLALAELRNAGLDHLVSRYITEKDGFYSTMIYCYPPAGKWRKEPPPALVDLVAQNEGLILTGPVIISVELKKIVWSDARWAMLFGSIVVLLFLIWDLGGIKAGFFSLFPLVLGLLWTLGAMGWMDLPVNFSNIFVFTMIIGIGVDYGIHYIHRWQESEGKDCEGVSKAIIIAAITTTLGFGSLVMSHYPGLRSLGMVAIIGTIATAIISISVLPAVLKIK